MRSRLLRARPAGKQSRTLIRGSAQYLRVGQQRSGARAGSKQARFYFGLKSDPTIDEIRPIARYYPLFRIIYGA